MMPIWLIGAFLVTALLYSSVGFGGGSTYTALLVFSGLQISLVPIVSLACNLAVTSSGTWKSRRAGLYDRSAVMPILACSVPAAFLGGLTPIGDTSLILLLGGSLLLASIQLAWTTFAVTRIAGGTAKPKGSRWLAPLIGAGIGYLSGLVGIGGGIFLAPVLHFIAWDSPRRIAALATAYIAANSLAGLAGKLFAQAGTADLTALLSYWPLLASVLIGSWFGHRFMLGLFPERLVKGLTAALIFVVAIRLLVRAYGGTA